MEKLYDYINKRIVPNKQNYIFIDEVQNIKDYYPKFLVTRDIEHKSYNGIMQVNVLDWLLEY